MINSRQELVSGHVFNAGGDENNHTKRSLVNEILRVVPDGDISYQKHGNDPRNYRVNFAKVRSLLGFEPKFSVADGINEICEAIQKGFFTEDVDNNNLYGNYSVE